MLLKHRPYVHWLWAIILACSVPYSMVRAATPPAPAINPYLDFTQQRLLLRSAFENATAVARPGAAEAAAVAAWAETLYHIGDANERLPFLSLLRRWEAASDRSMRAIARAWRLQFEAFDRTTSAIQELADSSSFGSAMDASDDARRKVLPRAREAFKRAREAIRSVPLQPARANLDVTNALLGATLDRLVHDDEGAIRSLLPFTQQSPHSPGEAIPWLMAVRLASEIEVDIGRPAGPRVDRLELAIDVASVFWSRHPLITAARQAVVAIAGAGNLRNRGRAAFARLEQDLLADKDVDARALEVATLAWEVEDLSAGRRWLIRGLRDRSRQADPMSDQWRDMVDAIVTFSIGGNPAREMMLVSALMEEPDLLPQGSPARRWALLSLAHFYTASGDTLIGPALIKSTASSAPPAKNAAVIEETSNPKAIEKAALQFNAVSDYSAQVLLLETALKLRRTLNAPFDESAAIAFPILIGSKVKIGATQWEIASLVNDMVDYSLQAALGPVPPVGEFDASLHERTYALNRVAEELEAANMMSPAGAVRRAVQERARARLRETVAAYTASGQEVRRFIHSIKDFAADLVSTNRPQPALGIYVVDALPIIFGDGTRVIDALDGLSILDGLADTFAILGEQGIAVRLRSEADLPVSVLKKETTGKLCARVTNAVRSGMAAPGYVASLAVGALIAQLAEMPCGAAPAEATPFKATRTGVRWVEEEARLRSISPLSAPSEKVNLARGRDCRPALQLEVDDHRRAILSLLDAEQAETFRNTLREARLIEMLAETYSETAGRVAIELRRMAIDLKVDRSGAPPEQIAQGLECLLADMLGNGENTSAAKFLAEVRERVRSRDGTVGVRALDDRLGAIKRRLGSLLPGSVVTQATDRATELAAAIAEISNAPPQALGDRILRIGEIIRVLPPSQHRSVQLIARLDMLQEAIRGKAAPNSAAAGFVALLRAEAELTSGAIEAALKYISQASSTKKDPAWNNVKASRLKGNLFALELFANETARGWEHVRRETSALADLEKRKAPLAEMVVRLSDLIDVARDANAFQVALIAQRRLASLDVPFGSAGYIERKGLMDRAISVARRCRIVIPLSLGADATPTLGECANVAVRMAAIAAEDMLSDDRRSSRDNEDEVVEDHDQAVVEALQEIAPLLQEQAPQLQDELTVLLRWYAARRATAVAAAARQRMETGTDLSGPPSEKVHAWRKARAAWMVEEGSYHCFGALGGEADALKLLSTRAGAARLAAEQAFSAMMGAIPEGRALPPIAPLDVAGLRKALNSDEAAVSLSVVGHNAIIWVIRRDSLHLHLVPWKTPQQDIDRLVGQFKGKLAPASLDSFQLSEAQKIYDVLFRPIMDDLSDVRALFIDADPITVRIPFAVLIGSPTLAPVWSVRDTWTPDWLVRHFAISLLPSLNALATSRAAPYREAREILAAGDPVTASPDQAQPDDPCAQLLGDPFIAFPETVKTLDAGAPVSGATEGTGSVPGARLELEAVMKLPGARGKLLTDAHFLPENFEDLPLRKFGLITLATHGLAETNRSPARLVMSPRKTTTGGTVPTALTATELNRIDLDADVVILSACDSGLKAGGGYNALVAALLRVGARQVIATAWPVGEQTAMWFTVPIAQHYLDEGSKNFDTTLQAAILRMIALAPGSNLRHPYYWAGFFILGASYRS